MYKAFKFRIYPDNNQEILINKPFGYYRFIYNYFWGKIRDTKYIKTYDMYSAIKVLSIELKKYKYDYNANVKYFCSIIEKSNNTTGIFRISNEKNYFKQQKEKFLKILNGNNIESISAIKSNL